MILNSLRAVIHQDCFILNSSSNPRKPHELVTIFIHRVSINVFAGKFEFNMRRVNGSVGGGILPDGKIDGRGAVFLIIVDVFGIQGNFSLRVR